MAGIYIHIPFCKTKCSYCDFYSKTDFSQQAELVQALLKETVLRKNYLKESVASIYFGGGTPSVLSIAEINLILQELKRNFDVQNNAEITLEANPDDLSFEYLIGLREMGISRLSMGIQSFDDAQLKAINRRHSADTALNSVQLAQQAGFNNISIDLIYGLPGQNIESWKAQVDKAMTLNVQHFSAYELSYEEGTVLWHQRKKGKLLPVDDETILKMYDYLIQSCLDNDYEHYEISNFAKRGYRSHHNSSYWKENPYLGIGPAAHSYNGVSRQWNVSSIAKYCRNIEANEIYYEKEILSPQDRYNDFVMVSLRTMDGINLNALEIEFGLKTTEYCLKSAKKYIKSGMLIATDNHIRLTKEGIMLSDQIIVDMMLVQSDFTPHSDSRKL